MYDRHLLDESEYLRPVYRFAGEIPPQQKEKIKGLRKPINKPANANQGGITTNTRTGEVTTPSTP